MKFLVTIGLLAFAVFLLILLAVAILLPQNPDCGDCYIEFVDGRAEIRKGKDNNNSKI